MASGTAESREESTWRRVRGFLREVVHRFTEDRCIESASELAFVTALSLAPATAVAFPLLLTLPFFRGAVDTLLEFVLMGFVPTGGAVIKEHVLEFARRAGQLTGPSLLLLLATVLVAMSTVEDKINEIWRVTKRRHWLPRLVVYWAVVSLGPALLALGLAVTSYLASLALRGREAGAIEIVLRVLPFITSILFFLLLYVIVPNRRVPVDAGFVGAVAAAILFELAKKSFSIYVSRYSSFSSLYGALDVLPVFLLWIYVSWLITLFGAELTCCLVTYHPEAHHARRRDTELGRALRLLDRLRTLAREGSSLSPARWMHEERDMPWESMEPVVGRLADARVVLWTDAHELVLARPLDRVTLRDLHLALGCPLPEPSSLPGHNRVAAAITRAHGALDESLGVPLAELLEESGDGQADTGPGTGRARTPDQRDGRRSERSPD